MAITSSWTRRGTITIDHTKVTTGSHTDFPVLLADGNFEADLYTNAKADGSDLRFTSDSAGTTELAFEIVSFTPASSLAEVWVKIPSLSSDTDTTIYVWYGNSDASAYSHTDTYGTHAVWSSSFQGVWHLQSGGGDSSANGYDLTVAGSPSNTAVKIKNGYEFTADTSKYMEVTSATNLNFSGNRTLECWGKTDNASADQTFIWLSTGTSGLRVQDSSGFKFTWYNTGMSDVAKITSDTNLNFLVGRWDGSNQTLFVNKTTNSNGAGTPGATGTSFYIGALSSSGTWPLDGKVDEVRIVSVARSDGWLNTEYDNQNSPSTFSAGSGGGAYTWPTSSGFSSYKSMVGFGM